MVRIGITGGIGSGKSTVASMFVRQGATLVDADAIARGLTGPGGSALPALQREFGSAILAPDGGLDRAAMRQRAFANREDKRRLETVLHPLITEQAQREAEAATASGASVLVFDVPLLVESTHWRARVQRVLVIDCRLETQIARVAARPGWTPDSATAVIAVQTGRETRRAVADAVIYNDGIDLAGLQAHTEVLWRLWNNSRLTM